MKIFKDTEFMFDGEVPVEDLGWNIKLGIKIGALFGMASAFQDIRENDNLPLAQKRTLDFGVVYATAIAVEFAAAITVGVALQNSAADDFPLVSPPFISTPQPGKS